MSQESINQTLIGRDGEEAAAEYLRRKGYNILEKNYRVGGAEVDLITRIDETLCFVEVKTRGSDNYGLPEEFVTLRKRRKIIRAALIYSTSHEEYHDFFIRFDILSILYEDGDIVFNHIQHAFQNE